MLSAGDVLQTSNFFKTTAVHMEIPMKKISTFGQAGITFKS